MPVLWVIAHHLPMDSLINSAPEAGSLNVFIVEDSSAVRESLHTLLSGIAGVSVIGFAADEADAIERINTLQPDFVILDLHLQQGTGLNVLINVKKFHVRMKVAVLSNYASALYVSACRQSGADYFFDKSFQFMLLGQLLAQLVSPEGLNGKIATLQQ
ncbi:MAG: response regulator transcription factor [Gallionella sp.]|nr:response regulator transcription factor [Gallionella sp.]